ncbi:MAG: prepilin-type N-terminal cleavage/methylation domain-containing protein [Deltaproteobacteria bacterium]|nr:prepilin-type N-terminal cleavage/methylation domain-containing protein [Deltaproteobacteria bacterium]
MDSARNTAFTARLGNNKGFTLIEMAIVLVIIGIIIGAIVKGGDLIANADEKKFKSEIDTIRAAYYTYYDKKGTRPTAIGSLTQANVGIDVNTNSNVKTSPQVAYSITTAGSLQVTNLTATERGDYDNKYDDGTLTSGDVQESSTNLLIRLK